MNGRTEAEQMAAEHEAANPPVRLTPEEIKATENAIWSLEGAGVDLLNEVAHTLRGLLERSA